MKTSSKDKTTLEIACEYLQLETADMLLTSGVDFRPGHNQRIIQELLVSHHSPLKQIIKFKILKLMIENGVDIAEFIPEIHRLALYGTDLSIISTNPDLQELDENVLIAAVYDHLGMFQAPTPNSYPEMISLLREIRPDLFDVFPEVTIEEFIERIDNTVINQLPELLIPSPTRIESIGGLEAFPYDHMFSNI